MKSRLAFKVCAATGVAALCVLSVLAAEPPSGTSSESVGGVGLLSEAQRSARLLGKRVLASDNERVGKLDDLVVDLESGRILYGIVALGSVDVPMVTTRVAVAPSVISQMSGDDIEAKADKPKIDNAPKFTSDVDKPEQVGNVNFVERIDQYFGQRNFWKGLSPATASSAREVLKLSSITSTKVRNENNEELGKVEDVVVDLPLGRLAYIVLSPDSGLNQDDNLFAFPPSAISVATDQKNLLINLPKDKLASAPHFAKDNWSDLNSATFAARVYAFYGKQAWFRTVQPMQPTGRTNLLHRLFPSTPQ